MPLPLPPSGLIDTDDAGRAPPGSGLVVAVLASMVVWGIILGFAFC